MSLDALVYWTPVLIHALLSGGEVSLGVSGEGGGGSEAAAAKRCGAKSTQLSAVLLTLVPFGLAAAASLALGHSSEVRRGTAQHSRLDTSHTTHHSSWFSGCRCPAHHCRTRPHSPQVTGERRRHIGLPLLVGGAAFALMPLALHAGSMVGAFLCVVAAVIAADATTGAVRAAHVRHPAVCAPAACSMQLPPGSDLLPRLRVCRPLLVHGAVGGAPRHLCRCARGGQQRRQARRRDRAGA